MSNPVKKTFHFVKTIDICVSSISDNNYPNIEISDPNNEISYKRHNLLSQNEEQRQFFFW